MIFLFYGFTIRDAVNFLPRVRAKFGLQLRSRNYNIMKFQDARTKLQINSNIRNSKPVFWYLVLGLYLDLGIWFLALAQFGSIANWRL